MDTVLPYSDRPAILVYVSGREIAEGVPANEISRLTLGDKPDTLDVAHKISILTPESWAEELAFYQLALTAYEDRTTSHLLLPLMYWFEGIIVDEVKRINVHTFTPFVNGITLETLIDNVPQIYDALGAEAFREYLRDDLMTVLRTLGIALANLRSLGYQHGDTGFRQVLIDSSNHSFLIDFALSETIDDGNIAYQEIRMWFSAFQQMVLTYEELEFFYESLDWVESLLIAEREMNTDYGDLILEGIDAAEAKYNFNSRELRAHLESLLPEYEWLNWDRVQELAKKLWWIYLLETIKSKFGFRMFECINSHLMLVSETSRLDYVALAEEITELLKV